MGREKGHWEERIKISVFLNSTFLTLQYLPGHAPSLNTLTSILLCGGSKRWSGSDKDGVSEALARSPATPVTGCVILGGWLCLSAWQFPHLQNEE